LEEEVGLPLFEKDRPQGLQLAAGGRPSLLRYATQTIELMREAGRGGWAGHARL